MMHEYDRDWYTAHAMKMRGGSFVKALGEAALHADPRNLELIKKTWPDHWKQYESVGIRIERETEDQFTFNHEQD